MHPPPPRSEAAPGRAPGSAHLWLLLVATAVGIPVVLALAAEAGLRAAGYGHPSAFTVPCTVRGRRAYCDNDRFTWQFFPPGAFRLPPAFAIPAEKPPATIRIFVVGESAAQGDPEPSYAFSRYLEVMLRERFPAVRFEVVNTGITAVNSHVLLPAARDLARHDGDLFVLYVGNNEVVGPFGAGTTLTARGSGLPLIRAGIAIKSTRLGQLLDGALRSVTTDRDRPAFGWRGMDMFLRQQVPADAPAMAGVYAHFRRNLRDIVEAARSSGARVVVSTVAVNLRDNAPFASLHRPGLTGEQRRAWETAVGEGAAFDAAGRHAEALKRFAVAAAIDDRHAELQFRIGRAYWALDDFAAASAHFARARDLDALRFRADSGINAIIRAVAGAAGPGVELVDAEATLADSSVHGVPGRDLFYDHVHLNARGNYLVARALFPRIVALLPATVRRTAAAAEPLAQADVERRLALTAYDRRRIARSELRWLSEAPFTGQLGHEEQLREVRRAAEADSEPVRQTALAYKWAMAQAPDDRWLPFNYGVFLEEYRYVPAAAASFRRALDLLPNNYVAADRLASALAELGDFDGAIAQCRALLRRMPYDPQAYSTMAYALAERGSYDESVAAFARAAELHPPSAAESYTNAGLVEAHRGRFDRAAAAFQKALALATHEPQATAIRDKLAHALEQLGQHAEAERVLAGAAASARLAPAAGMGAPSH